MTKMTELLEIGRDMCSFLPIHQLGPSTEHDVYISPHCDDICFSLGCHVAERGEGTLLGVCSRSKFLGNTAMIEAEKFLELSLEAQIMFASATRLDEDKKFAERTSLKREYCNLDEATLRDCHPFDPAIVSRDYGYMASTVMRHVRDLAVLPVGGLPGLYCPIGIGGHVDHLIVRETILENVTELRGLFDIRFYEDLPYACQYDVRRQGLRDFFARVAPFEPQRIAFPVRMQNQKIDLVGIYASQIDPGPVAIRKYSPALMPFSPVHEAIWVLGASTS